MYLMRAAVYVQFTNAEKNSPSLRTHASLRGSNEEGLPILHITEEWFESSVDDQILVRAQHNQDTTRRKGKHGHAVARYK